MARCDVRRASFVQYGESLLHSRPARHARSATFWRLFASAGRSTANSWPVFISASAKCDASVSVVSSFSMRVPSRSHSIRHRRTVDVSIEVTRLRIILARKMSLSVVYPHLPFTRCVASLLCGRHRSTYLAKRPPRAAIPQSRLAWPPPRLRARARVQFSPGSGDAVRSCAPTLRF